MALRAFASQAASALRISSRTDRNFLFRHFSSKFPEDLKYAKTHEWFKVNGGQGTMGLTPFAVEELGDVVNVLLPEVGSKYEPGEIICTVLSRKSSIAVYAPVGGEVLKVNYAVKYAPEELIKDPFGESWLLKLKLANSQHLESLLSAGAYEAITKKKTLTSFEE